MGGDHKNIKEPSGGSGKFYRDITKSSLNPPPPPSHRNLIAINLQLISSAPFTFRTWSLLITLVEVGGGGEMVVVDNFCCGGTIKLEPPPPEILQPSYFPGGKQWLVFDLPRIMVLNNILLCTLKMLITEGKKSTHAFSIIFCVKAVVKGTSKQLFQISVHFVRSSICTGKELRWMRLL